MAKISYIQLARYAANELEKGSSARAVAQRIAAALLDARQSRDLPKVMRLVEEELNRRGSTQVSIVSAHNISDAAKQELAELLDAKNPVFHEEIDPSVIGGVSARSGETEIDLTVRGKLNKFKASIVNQV